MLRLTSDINGYAISASDGLIGHIEDVLFDDQTWLMRWVVVQAGGWFGDRKVLLPTSSLGHVDPQNRQFGVRLTRLQVKDSPDIDADKSVSRFMEENVYNYYGWAPYWGYAGFYFGPESYLDDVVVPQDKGDTHLRSVAAVTGYVIHATDGEIGHVQSFIMEETDWSIRYMVVDTKNWWPGNQVLVSPGSILRIEWSEHKVYLCVDRQKIKNSPPFRNIGAIDRAYSRSFVNYYADVIS